jgi:hypothetical protein
MLNSLKELTEPVSALQVIEKNRINIKPVNFLYENLIRKRHSLGPFTRGLNLC